MSLTFPQMPDKFTTNETTILEYLNRHSNAFLFLNIAQLAAKLDVSEATISRFARHVGCRDFKDLKQVVMGQVERPGPTKKATAVLDGGEENLLPRFFEQQKYCLEKTLELMDQNQFAQAAQAIADAGRVYVYAKNGSRSMSELLIFRLWRIGVDVHRLSAGGGELLEGLAAAGQGDLVVVFSFSKLTPVSSTILDLAAQTKYKTLLFTGRVTPDQGHPANYQLFVYRGEEAGYHSMTAPAALVDALVLEVSARLGPKAAEQLDRLRRLKKHYSKR